MPIFVVTYDTNNSLHEPEECSYQVAGAYSTIENTSKCISQLSKLGYLDISVSEVELDACEIRKD